MRSTLLSPVLAVTVVVLALGAGAPAHAQTFKVLHTFAGYPTDGGGPTAVLLMDASGNIYGTTVSGGSVSNGFCPGGCGTVFELDTHGVEIVLHSFTGPDGANPVANLIMDGKGNLYGTTAAGGLLDTFDCTRIGTTGCGVIFKLSGSKQTVLHRFTGVDGAWPQAGLAADRAGTLYGTTSGGGDSGYGVVFKLAGKNETVLHSFTGGKDGRYPQASLLRDPKGNFYGTVTSAGDLNCHHPYGCGVVFKLSQTGKETVLHSFRGEDGDGPFAGVIQDAKGNLYGTTSSGGNLFCDAPYGCGAVFKLSQAGKESVLFRFEAYRNGDGPGGLVRDARGNLYGTTAIGGGRYNEGVVYELTTDGKEKILHTFCSSDYCSDGAYPLAGLIMDAKGNLYGTTYYGGVNDLGVIFMITP
jgi:uncharacterized repeat protein (TIGR03803 family)